MMHEVHLADVLFILLVGGLIWGILWLVGRSRARRTSKDDPRCP